LVARVMQDADLAVVAAGAAARARARAALDHSDSEDGSVGLASEVSVSKGEERA